MEYREPYLPTTAEDFDRLNAAISEAGARVASGRYWPGQDYPDHEEWLAKRYTPPRNRRAALYFNSTRWGTLDIGINVAKRKARAERAYFRTIPIVREGQPLHEIMREDGSPSLHRQLMTIRRKAQTQGFVAIEPDAASQAQREQKRGLR